MSEAKSKEREFTSLMKTELENNLPDYFVTSGESLIYKFLVDAQGQLHPKNVQYPKRGQLAFQTDLMIKKKLRVVTLEGVPLVVIEVKFGRFTTHDVLTYSAKAMRHKEIYPYLRYGLVIRGVKKIDKRFFTHNSGFDFAIAVEETENLSEVTRIIRQQAQDAENMLKVFEGKEVKQYVSNIEFR
jgi:hypothetical protein